MLFALGGLVQINPIWLWGPYETALGTNGAQPDWYLGWLIGALRLMPGFDVTIGNYTLIANPFWGGILFPTLVLARAACLSMARAARHAATARAHNLLDRPRDAPGRTAFGAAFLAWVVLIFIAGALDRSTVFFGLSYATEVAVARVAVWILPLVLFFAIRRLCRALQRADEVEAIQARAEAEARGRTVAARGRLGVPRVFEQPGEIVRHVCWGDRLGARPAASETAASIDEPDAGVVGGRVEAGARRRHDEPCPPDRQQLARGTQQVSRLPRKAVRPQPATRVLGAVASRIDADEQGPDLRRARPSTRSASPISCPTIGQTSRQCV